jgi:hypothetical protein
LSIRALRQPFHLKIAIVKMRVTRRTSGERKSWCTFAVSFLRPRSVVSDLGRIFSIIDIICFLLNVVGAKEKPMIRINHRLRKRRTEQSRSGEVPGRFHLFTMSPQTPLPSPPTGRSQNPPQTQVALLQKVINPINQPAPFPSGKGGGIGPNGHADQSSQSG